MAYDEYDHGGQVIVADGGTGSHGVADGDKRKMWPWNRTLSLILVLGLVGLICVCGWYAHKRQQFWNVVVGLRQKGAEVGLVVYAPPWIHRCMGDNLENAKEWLFAQPVYIAGQGTEIDDQDMERIKTWNTLTHLCLADTRITDKGVAFLVDLPRLDMVNASKTGVTDRALDHLKEIGSLRFLIVKDTAVTTAGLTLYEEETDVEVYTK